MQCSFETTKTEAGYRHTCRNCGATYLIARKRMARICDRIGCGQYLAMVIVVFSLNLITSKRVSAFLKWITRGKVAKCRCKTWESYLNRWVWPF